MWLQISNIECPEQSALIVELQTLGGLAIKKAVLIQLEAFLLSECAHPLVEARGASEVDEGAVVRFPRHRDHIDPIVGVEVCDQTHILLRVVALVGEMHHVAIAL